MMTGLPLRNVLKVISGTSVAFALANSFEGRIGEVIGLSGLVGCNLAGTRVFQTNLSSALRLADRSLLGATFLHCDAAHAIPNSAILSMTWHAAANLYGVEHTLALYISGGLATSAWSAWRNGLVRDSMHQTVGSSGAVCAVLAATLWNQDVGPIIAPAGTMALLLVSAGLHIGGKTNPIDHSNHIIGLLVGTGYGVLNS